MIKKLNELKQDNTESDKKNLSDEWLLRLNIDKSYCVKHPTDTSYHIMDRNQLFPLKKVKSMVDLGLGFYNNLTLKYHNHISEKINKDTVS